MIIDFDTCALFELEKTVLCLVMFNEHVKTARNN